MRRRSDLKSLFNQILTGVVVAILLIALFALAPCLGLCWLIKGAQLLLGTIHSGNLSLWVFGRVLVHWGICFVCFVIQWRLVEALFTKYTFCSDGVNATLWKRFTRFIPWEDFQEVCICHADYYSRPDGKLTKVICLVRNGEKKNIYGRWKVDNFLRYLKIIRLDYTTELHEKIANLYPGEIVDYCNF